MFREPYYVNRQKVDKMFRSGAPEIERIYELRNKKSPGQYCAVCLRTDNERALVDNGTFKKFLQAVNLEHHWKSLQAPKICYMCDRQAMNALKFYRATQFAASINRIFTEIKLKEKSVRKHIFHKTHFKKMMLQLNLGDEKILPSQWESELKIIRRRSQLYETTTLVIDSLGVKINDVDNKINLTRDEFTNTILSTPDQIPKQNNVQTADKSTNRGTKKKSTNEGSKTNGRNVGFRRRVEEMVNQLDEPAIQIKSTNSVIVDDEEETDPLKVETLISDSEDTDETLSANGDECSEIPSTSIDPQPRASNDPPPQASNDPTMQASNDPTMQASNDPTMQASNDPPMLTPKLVPIEKLLEKPIIETSSGRQYVLHPIILNGTGALTVPTLTAHIIDGQLLGNNILMSPLNNNNVIMPNGQLQQMYSTVVPVPQIETNTKKRKADVATPIRNDADMATQSKRQMLPVEKSSENRTIDWEDKIPMDVISFMDAVDPNYEKIPNCSMTPNIGVISNNTSRITQNLNTSSCDVIDLC